jgi:hypothetical protein
MSVRDTIPGAATTGGKTGTWYPPNSSRTLGKCRTSQMCSKGNRTMARNTTGQKPGERICISDKIFEHLVSQHQLKQLESTPGILQLNSEALGTFLYFQPLSACTFSRIP